MNHVDIFVNGKKVDTDRIRGLFSEEDILVFESLKSYQGKVFRLDQHLNRLFESAKTAGLKLPKAHREFFREVNCLAHLYPTKNRFIRLGADQTNSYVFILSRTRSASIYQEGVLLKTAVTRRNFVNSSPPEVKSSDFFNNLLATLELGNGDAFDVVFLDLKGYLAESTIWNFFIVKNNTLFTPGTGILSGVTRQFVIECAEKERIPISETFLTRHDFWNAEEAFLTNTSGEIVPIRMLDGRKIGSQIPGPVTKRLMKRFKQELEKELVSSTKVSLRAKRALSFPQSPPNSTADIRG